MKRIVALLVSLVLFLSMVPAVHAYETPVTSSNKDEHYYVNAGRFNDPITSTLEVTEDGYTRVEYVGDRLIAEKYDRNFQFVSGMEIQLELPIYGGVYLCEDYNFVVVGQTNYEEDDAREVFRIIRYSKDWVRQDSASIYGANTYIPFDAGSLRFARSGDILYIRTSHEMYTSEDGLNHQANVMIAVRISDMTVTDQLTKVWNKNYGYVSHSFNQFVLVDGKDLLAVDHGDAIPRAVVLFKYRIPAGQESFYGRVDYVNALPIVDSTSHYNDTGVSVGGFEASSDHYLIAGSSADQSQTCDLMYAHRNIFVTATPKDNFTDDATTVRWLTSFKEEDNVEVSPPHLVKLSSDRFFLIWTENGQIRYCTLNGKGEPEGEIRSAEGDLSDCVPVVDGGKVIWYVTDYSAPRFYVIDPDAAAHTHSYTAQVTAPTCQTKGYTTYTCSCGDSYVDNYTNPVDHSYEDGRCKWCGIQASPMSGICGDDLTWVLTEDGVLTISGTGAMYDYEYMGAPWCADLEDIRQIVIQDGATGIGTNAFREAVNLTGVSLSDTITQIGNFAFYGDVRLADMELPANLESLGQEAFAHSALTAVELPGSLTFIDAAVFYSCTSLTDVVIHSGDAPSLMFGNSPFRGCTALEEIHVDEGHFALLDIDGVLYAYFNEGYELLQYPLGRKDPTLSIEEGTLIINMLAVEAALYLEEVTIPASVSEICTFAFSGSTNLKTIRFLGDAPVIGGYAFSAVTADCCYPAGNATWTDDVMQSYGGELTWKPDAVQAPTVKWSSISTSLGGNIGMNFYVELSENLVSDPDAYIQFSFAGRTIQVPLSEGKPSDKNGVTVYQFSCPITSKNMTDEITAQVYNADGAVGEPKSMSVDTYCNWVIANFKDEKTVNLMKGMLNYGASAQKLFNYRTDDLANATLAEADKVFGAVDASAYKHSVEGTEDGIIAKSMTLLLDSETTVRVYFELTGDKPIEDYTFTVDGVEVQPTFKDGKYYIERPNISAHRLDDMHVFTCGGITVTYGGLSYVNQVMTYYKSGTTFEMASALYAYSKAAEAYIG